MIKLLIRPILSLLAVSLLAGTAQATTVTLLPQEQAIANDLVSNPAQGRPYMILDPVIEAVARARAKDMAVRNYFSHVNPDGVAANYLLRQAGYQLPAWWGTDPTANYVESIAAGYSSPSDTWTQWMNSPPHKEHLLAMNSFFATETHYGVGYYYDPNSTYQYYWVVITAPPQPIEITAPAPNVVVYSGTVTVAGSADPGTYPAMIQYRVENTTGTSAYQPAAGLASWSGTETALAPGENLIRAQSLDGSGNLIAETTSHLNYIVPVAMTVTVSGSGTVTNGYAGTTVRNEGTVVTLKAQARAGSIFAGWTGSIVSGSAVIRFPVEEGTNLQANFEPTPFLPVVGPYYGILTTGSGAQSGMMGLTVGAYGSFTGRVTVGTTTYSFSGCMDLTGSASVDIPVRGQAPMVLDLQADLTGGSGQLTGTLTDGAASYGYVGSQATFNAVTAKAPEAGRYTLVLPPNPDTTGTSLPQGSGYASIVVSTGGGAAVTGRLADGTPYSAVGHVANDGSLSLYCVPSGAPRGSTLTGELVFRSTDASDLDGVLTWTRAADAAVQLYPAGFSTALPCIGSHYSEPAPATGLLAMDVSPGTATAAFAAGDLAQAISVPVAINRADKVIMTVPGAPDVSMAINPASGTVAGTFVMPGSKLVRTVRGVVLQKQQTAYGYFLGIDQGGCFSLTPGS